MADETVDPKPPVNPTSDGAMADKWSYRLVIIGLVFALTVAVLGMIALPYLGKEIPSELGQVAMPIITGLAAILSPLANSLRKS